jgi:transcriptional regulator with XRE-family HTH domain
VYGVGEVTAVLDLATEGHGPSEIARRTGISVRTVIRWLNGEVPRPNREPLPDARKLLRFDTERPYVYLLGVYLGDGYLAEMRRGVFHLRIALDLSYPRIIGEAAHSVSDVLPNNRVSIYRHTSGHRARIVGCYSKLWPILLPQHGTGPKHLRPIRLTQWQRDLTLRYPETLVRGLIHSDGSRFVANQRSRGRLYSYPRYCFSNASTDIMDIFCEHLDLLGIHWTMTRPDQAQIARKQSVALLDSFVGPKC